MKTDNGETQRTVGIPQRCRMIRRKLAKRLWQNRWLLFGFRAPPERELAKGEMPRELKTFNLRRHAN